MIWNNGCLFEVIIKANKRLFNEVCVIKILLEKLFLPKKIEG